MRKLTDEQVRAIRERRGNISIAKRRAQPDATNSIKQIAKEFGISTSAVSLIANGKAWRHVT